jgi:hypothetical protein
MTGIKIDRGLSLWFFEALKALGYLLAKTAEPFSTRNPFWIWDFNRRFGTDKF